MCTHNTENASGKAKLWPSFFQSFREMGKAPVKFVKSPQFLWIWLVYGSTYLAANVVDTVCKGKNMDSALPKWIATSTTNTSTCIAKDRAFAKLFGATTTSGPVPLGSYGAWLGRDLLSMAVFFSLPPIVGKEIAKVSDISMLRIYMHVGMSFHLFVGVMCLSCPSVGISPRHWPTQSS